MPGLSFPWSLRRADDSHSTAVGFQGGFQTNRGGNSGYGYTFRSYTVSFLPNDTDRNQSQKQLRFRQTPHFNEKKGNTLMVIFIPHCTKIFYNAFSCFIHNSPIANQKLEKIQMSIHKCMENKFWRLWTIEYFMSIAQGISY